MSVIKYMLVGIFGGIFNMYPLASDVHFKVFRELFNTDIFNDSGYISFLNISMIISVILIYRNDIIIFLRKLLGDLFRKVKNKSKKEKRIKSVNVKYLKCIVITSLLNILFHAIFRFKVTNIKSIGYLYIVTIIILVFTRGKNNTRTYSDITYVDAILIGMSSMLSIIPTISILLCNLFCAIKQRIRKKTSLRYALTCLIPVLLIDSIPGILYFINNTNYVFEMIIGCIASIFVSCFIYKSLKYMCYTNKFHRLGLYILGLVIFIFYWFS